MRIFSHVVKRSANTESAILNLKGKMKPPLPVVIYGAGMYATKITRFLDKHGIKVDDYFVSDGYENDPLIEVPNVRTLSEVMKKYSQFNVVIGRGELEKACRLLQEVKGNRISGVYQFLVEGNCDYEFFQSHGLQFQEVYDMLSDELSKKTLINVLSARITADPMFLADIHRPDIYFPRNLIALSKEEVFVDGGAFNGDTLKDFVKVTAGQYRQFYAFEPSPANFSALQETAREMSVKNVVFFSKGLWSNLGMLSFAGRHGSYSSIVSATLNSGSGSSLLSSIEVDTVDDLCPDATFIKLDVEGAELEALKGASNTIRNNHPKLAICVYHKPEDLFEIPLYVKSLVPEYRLFLRHHSEMQKTDTVLYALI